MLFVRGQFFNCQNSFFLAQPRAAPKRRSEESANNPKGRREPSKYGYLREIHTNHKKQKLAEEEQQDQQDQQHQPLEGILDSSN